MQMENINLTFLTILIRHKSLEKGMKECFSYYNPQLVAPPPNERMCRQISVAIAVISCPVTNMWLVILRFRSLLVVEHKGTAETSTSFSEKKETSRAGLMLTCFWWPFCTKAALEGNKEGKKHRDI